MKLASGTERLQQPSHRPGGKSPAIRVGVDSDAFSYTRTGVGRYAGELLAAAARLGTPHCRFEAVLFDGRAPNPELLRLEGSGVRLRRPSRVARRSFYVARRLGVRLPFELVASRQDVMLFPNYRAHRTLGTPCATIIYDLGYLVLPDTVHPRFIRRLRRIAPHAVAHSDAVITISKTVAGEIIRAYPEAAERVRVIPPGVSTMFPAEPPRDWQHRLRRLGLAPGYLLHVGTLEPRKNLGTLLSAVRHLPAERRLVLVGDQGWSNDDLLAGIDSAGERVRWLSYLPDPDLRAVYEGADLLVFPSRYEGFGLPVLEAMAVGLPIACSDIPVLREVGGDAVAYFDNTDPITIADTVMTLLHPPDRLRAMAKAGRERAALFSWEEAGRRLLDLMTELAGGRR